MIFTPVIYIENKRYTLKSGVRNIWDYATFNNKKIEIHNLSCSGCKKVSAAILIDPQGRILIARRNYGKHKGVWEFPGGKLEGKENPDIAIIREIKEELDIDANYPLLFDISMQGKIVLYSFFLKLTKKDISSTDHDKTKLLYPHEIYRYPLLELDKKVTDHIMEIIKEGYDIKWKHAEDRT
ncbi:NUDIX domain-containing protein [Spirochaetia bacterium 38H-sp]|uniref:8-oxo-dGTP diphosphatase n=1 Tax=Rarispira pelagica TaxID=3141764 RepID=A0ABU9UB05_9SPIR